MLFQRRPQVRSTATPACTGSGKSSASVSGDQNGRSHPDGEIEINRISSAPKRQSPDRETKTRKHQTLPVLSNDTSCVSQGYNRDISYYIAVLLLSVICCWSIVGPTEGRCAFSYTKCCAAASARSATGDKLTRYFSPLAMTSRRLFCTTSMPSR